MNEICFGDLKVKHVLNPRLKNSYIRVDGDGTILLKTPKVSKIYIDELLAKRESWIKKQLQVIKERETPKVIFEDQVLIFGEIVSIDLEIAKPLRLLLERLKNQNEQNISKCYDGFYKEVAKEYLTKRVLYFSKIMSLTCSEIVFKKMRSRWGSCSSKKRITLNTQLIKLEKRLIDYVVVHELAHLVHMNHSKNFHSLVGEHLPDYKILIKEIRKINLKDS